MKSRWTNTNIVKVTRVFHPVGQGGFYTESLDDQYMVVYDCGGNTKSSMQTYLDSLFSKDTTEKIDAVFISHLHNDHINGLDDLLRVTTVKKIFLPLLTRNKIVEALLFNAAFASKQKGLQSNELILDLINPSSQEYPSVIEVTDVEEATGTEFSFSLGDESHFPPSIPSGTRISIPKDTDIPSNPNLVWVYIPYSIDNPVPLFDEIQSEDTNYNLKPLINEIERFYVEYEEIEDKQWKRQRSEDFVKLLKKETSAKLKEAYRLLYGGIHNSQSMCVFSGLLGNHEESLVEFETQTNLIRSLCIDNYCDGGFGTCHPNHYRVCWNKFPCNFLYMGDFEAKKNFSALKNFYEECKVWDTICGVQIPHHGSRDNHIAELYMDKCFAVASTGIKNKYGHPHIDALIGIASQGCCPNVVTDDINTLKYQQFYIR